MAGRSRTLGSWLFLGSFTVAFALLVLFVALADAVAPAVTVENASDVSYASAHVEGTVDPQGVETFCHFEFISQAQLDENAGNGFSEWEGAGSAPCDVEPVTGSGSQPVEAELQGLAAATVYHLRLIASNADGTEAANASTFTTLTGNPPAVTIGTASAVTARTAHISGTVDPEGGTVDPVVGVLPISWQLEVARASEPGAWQSVGSGTIEGAPAEGSTPIAVEATFEGLDPATEYDFRLVASYPGGQVASDENGFLTEADAPSASGISVTEVLSSAATLNASVNPGGASTSYHFEYLTRAAFEAAGDSFAGAQQTPESAPIGSDIVDHPVSVQITGLEQDTSYRFRLVATNAKGVATTSVGALRTAAPAAAGDDCPNAAVRAQQDSGYLPECRAYEMVSNPGLGLGDASRVPAMSNDGTIVAYTAPLPDEISLGGGTVTIGVARRGPSGWSRESGDPSTYGSLTGNLGLTEPIAFSPDFTKELVNTNLPADPNDPDNKEDYYAVDVGQGTSTLMTQGLVSFPFKPLGASPDLSRVIYSVTADNSELGIFASDGTDKELISVDENGDPFFNPTPAGSAADRGLNVGVGPGSHRPFVAHGGVHAVSEDAQRVYFYGSAETVTGLGEAGSLYLNDHGTSTAIAPVALFLSAAADGSSAYFASLEELAPGAGPGGGIYRYDVASEEITLIVPATDPGGLNLSSAMASNDQTHLYFTSNNALAGDAVAGEWNAYVWTEAGLRFIAKVEEPDKFERVGLDGGYAVLLSNASIDGAPNNGHRAVYEYVYATDETLCVSCRPDGSLSHGGASIEDQPFNIPNSPSTQSRALAEDGRVVFNSRDRLTSEDESTGQDVYIYNQGRVGLLSSGEELTDSYVGDVSDDGRHVAIITRGALLGVDRDPREFDIYDVASEGGFLEPPPPPAPCSGEECRGPSSSAPDQVAVPTAGLIAPEKARECRRGKVRRHGRCVKKKHHGKKHKPRRHSAKRDGSNKGGTGR